MMMMMSSISITTLPFYGYIKFIAALKQIINSFRFDSVGVAIENDLCEPIILHGKQENPIALIIHPQL